MTVAMRLLLVDDEPLALQRLELTLRDMPNVEIVGTARDGDAALDEALRLKPDLIILDVEMPGRNGLSVAATLERENGAEIIILSAFDRYAASAFEVEAIDYLLKPLRPVRLSQALETARRRRVERAARVSMLAEQQADEQQTLHVPDSNGGRDIPIADVIWIEAAKDYAIIHTRMRSHIIRVTMVELSERLPDNLLRVHRSAFVALSEVRRWGAPSKGVYSLILSDDTEVKVGPNYIAEVRMALRSLFG
jgi:DNA-binding LytR/AlgR family response regulator